MINGDTLHNPFTPFRHLQLPATKPLRHKISFLHGQSSSTSRCFEFLSFRRNPNFKFVRSKNSKTVELGTGLFMGSDESDSLVEISYTRTLPPALTLEHGLTKIKEAVEKLKLDPLHSKSGVVRFQVAVPPNPKAWNWLRSQFETLKVFPQFYLSKIDKENPTIDPLLNNGVLGISGIGAAVYFTSSSSSALRKWRSIKRYLSADSSLVRAYGFIGINFDVEASSMRHETGSFYFFIPQIELDEYGSTSLLAATLAWDDDSLCSFDNAVCSLELSIYQAIYQFLSSEEIFQNKSISSTLTQPDMVEVVMAYINVHSQVGEYASADHLQLEGALTSTQFYFRLSPSSAFANNMLDHPSELRCSVQYSVNINAVWASLIIEECSRLGLTYFCIAPGSRSSPLAVAASTHPLTVCISCYDERSLAFHAVGYARGSGRPAIVITSSGTAVSNLLPAVVEASHDFVPLLLLTADRPHELHDVGANQAINQVNHFGSFVRYFFSLPPPTDDIPARMVLTTVDSAVYWATNAPYGPVHINCPFRDPLEGTPQEWKLSCLKGLDFWISRAEPFTQYIRMSRSQASNGIYGQIAQVIQLIQCAHKGLLLIGAIHSENEVWAALLLAKHLSWPIVADILSGLRLRKALTSFPGIDEKLLFIDHLDHALLSDSVRGWANPDVIVQIGGRITSKRICQMIEICAPCSYIMVDQHPYRHDPSHVVTHRIQSSITDFADSLLRVDIPRMTSKWRDFLHGLNEMVAWEIAFQIQTQCSITEPYVAQVISEEIPNDAALFIGNSMVIRDADMYASGWVKHTTGIFPIRPNWGLPCLGIRTAGNRGASGIDGLLSTSIGFAVGCNKRVFCMIGDISFLHDTNGLAILNQRSSRKPMTILVINNHGGAIFSLLPIADTTQQSVLNQYFYTSHNMSVRKLCDAHSVKYLQVRTKMELRHALMISEQANTDCIIEVESCIEDNASFHRTLRKFGGQAADHALSIISRISVPEHTSSGFFFCKIHKMECSLYRQVCDSLIVINRGSDVSQATLGKQWRFFVDKFLQCSNSISFDVSNLFVRIQLSAPPTSSSVSDEPARFYREGFILSLYLEDGNVGFGEVAPLEIHKETLADAEEQIRFLIHVIQGAKMNYLLPLLKGSFSSWIWESLGLPPLSIFPSVRCGFEMAILNALAATQGSTLSNLLLGYPSSIPQTRVLESEEVMKKSSGIQICALLDSNGTPEEVAHVAEELVKEGFTTIKLKVARRATPYEDAAVIQEVRKKVGHKIILRVDANRRWTYKEATQFGSCVKYCGLQYIEEPVLVEDEIIKFCEETGLPVALDETIDNIQGDPLNRLAKFVHPGIVAIVIKPSVVGGFENAALIGKWAQQQNKMAVVSAAFESTLSLSTYILFSHYLEEQHREISRMEQKELRQPVAHGFGTYRWLREDVTEPIKILGRPHNELVEASVEDAAHVLRNFKINHKTIQRRYTGEQVRTYQVKVKHDDFSISLKVQEVGIKENNNDVLIFLHGFLGTSEDWIPIMKAISASAQCISIDLPGHGESNIENHDNCKAKQESSMSIEVISNLLCKAIQDITTSRVVIVGYSMGARIALYMALRCCDQINGAVLLSGSPGIKDVEVRRRRMAHDDARARLLTLQGLQFFLDTWYAGELWDSLRAHPHFEQTFSSRMQHDDVHALAKTLSDLSIGKQPTLSLQLSLGMFSYDIIAPISGGLLAMARRSLWEELKQCKKPLLFVVGEKDMKFRKIAKEMCNEIASNLSNTYDLNKGIHEMIVIPDCGHAVHIENPLSVISAVSQFLTKLK